ncbi:MAG: hypothetical protein GY759_22010 [Chloroflexi bacterium]|nr:hypothetical protein [Chloroflexota bacterium]
MERGTFINSAVAEELENNFVEARMHTDRHPEFRDFEMLLIKTVGQPIYVVVSADSDLDFTSEGYDPGTVKILARQDGVLNALIDPSSFADFLKSSQ